MRVMDLCAGIGGISLAAHWAGMETVAFCEIEPFCQKVLNKHWPHVPIFDDLRKLDKQALIDRGVIGNGRTIDVITGGYPCQPFSLAGKRKGEEDDRHLWPEFKRLIQEIRPSWFVGENVAGHITMGLDAVLTDLEALDYTTQTFVIPACAVNAPHRRDRVFIIANANSIGDNPKEELRINGNRTEEMQERIESQCGLTDIAVGNPNSQPELQTNTSVITERSSRKSWKSTSGINRRIIPGEYWKTNQPTVCGVDDGATDRFHKDRLKALGNMVVPQQVYPIFEAIMKIG